MIINRNAIQGIEQDLEHNARSYYKAQSKIATINLQLADYARRGEAAPKSLITEIEDAEFDLKWHSERVQELKAEYVKVIEKITL